MKSLAIVNQKGGVGKTTVVLGLAAAAWAAGRRCVVIDLDPQGNATSGLGLWDIQPNVETALAADRPGALTEVLVPATWQSSRTVHRDGFDEVVPTAVPLVAPSSPALAVREPQLANDPIGAQDRLAVTMQGLDHDVVLIDCPPSLGLLTVNGLFAADRALVVTEPGAWASDGVGQIVRTVGRVATRRPTPLELAGIAVNRLGRTRDARYWHEQLVDEYPEQCFAPIHLRAALPEAAAQSLPIHALGARPGAPEAAAEFDELFSVLFPEETPAAESPAATPFQAGAHGV
ncbi:MAG: ParA family protein [Acidimicrobiales bacterium]|nr:ParA family protein [Acidimicrobiales bacterium]